MHRWWVVPLAVLAAAVLVAVGVAALLPAELVADKDVHDPDDPAVTVEQETPYARVPASAEPVAERVSFGALEGVAELDEDREGDFFFVTISEPQQSVLSWWAAGGRPAAAGVRTSRRSTP